MHEQPTDKHGKPISEGDTLVVKSHTGDFEGEVEKIILTEPEAVRESVKNPPKIVLRDKEGNVAHHNPESLEHRERDKEYQSSREVGA